MIPKSMSSTPVGDLNPLSGEIMPNQSLKVGVAGLGTVGTALVSQVAHQRDALAARCGRPIEIVAVCARSRGKDRGMDLRKMKWFGDPQELATEALARHLPSYSRSLARYAAEVTDPIPNH